MSSQTPQPKAWISPALPVAERGDRLGRDAPGREGELGFCSPGSSTGRLLFRAVDVDAGFVPDPLFSLRILFAFRYGGLAGFPSSKDADKAFTLPNRNVMSYSREPSRVSRRTFTSAVRELDSFGNVTQGESGRVLGIRFAVILIHVGFRPSCFFSFIEDRAENRFSTSYRPESPGLKRHLDEASRYL